MANAHLYTPVSRPHLLPHLACLLRPQGITWHLLCHEPLPPTFAIEPWMQVVDLPPIDGLHNCCYSKLNRAWLFDDLGDDDWVNVLCDDDGIPADFYARLCLDDVPADVDALFVPVTFREGNSLFTRLAFPGSMVPGYCGIEQPIVRWRVIADNPKPYCMERILDADGLWGEFLARNYHCDYRNTPSAHYNEYQAGREWGQLAP